jgi:hypothetical protein
LWLSAVSQLCCPQLTPVTGTGTHHNRLPAQRIVNNASSYVTKKKALSNSWEKSKKKTTLNFVGLGSVHHLKIILKKTILNLIYA